MLEDIKKNIERLIAAYEAEKAGKMILEKELHQCMAENETYRKQIIELERQIDSLKLKCAFMTASGDGNEAKSRIEKMIKDIDKCISLIEKE